MKIGYLGLGLLGAPIARCIAKNGFALTVYDIAPAAMDAFDEPGVAKAASPVEAAQASDILIACVRSDEDLVAVADDALFAAIGTGGILMIHSTVSPELCQSLAEKAAPHGVSILDCGVSRGGGSVVDGDLSIYLGGDDGAVEQAKPLLDALGSWRHLGPVGRGMQGKLLNNLVSIAMYGMSAHILELGEHLGFEREPLREMLMAGSANSFAMKVAPNFTQPDRAANMHNLLGKDVKLARKLAAADQPSLKALTDAAQSMIDLLAGVKD